MSRLTSPAGTTTKTQFSSSARGETFGQRFGSESPESALDKDSEPSGDDSENDSEDDSEGDDDLRESDVWSDELDRMKANMNRANPFDVSTKCGQYATIHVVLEHFKDNVGLHKLTKGPSVDPEADDEAIAELSRGWQAEVDAIVRKLPVLTLTDSTPAQQELNQQLESLRNTSSTSQ
ncbi:uncharacterized protein LY89DRAFT_741991 [Mollisia scopiformis]|uniref:Uncharacterized protein n=1 Tax=Mollisia scopiformis TaxID=149040 RepID=A0A132B904_MOLSC|nr:uncharacterized protein LY89DRAFT_741991 [Mollisia scopiformis]KUJ08147.1 hypothetical protein LY89DRAFT_741991 [Mollisia scopiformis]